MPVSIPGTGWPDHEERPMPHGATLLTETGQTATVAGYILDNGGDGYHVAAYRSLVVVVVNSGLNDIYVTPRWSFWDASSSVYTEQTKRAPAGVHTWLLFQNEADFIQRIKFATLAGTSLFSHYFTGSNLDPLPVSAMPLCHLVGVAAGVQTSATGVGFNCQFQQSPAFSLITDPTVFSLNTVAPGVADTVTLLTGGLYVATGAFTFDGAAAFARQASLVMRNGTGPPRPNAPTLDGSAANENDYALADILPVSDADAGTGTATVQLSGLQTSGGNIIISAAMLRIVRLSPLPPY